MPANRSSLRVTEAYRKRMVALREQAKREARQTWAKIEPHDVTGSYEVGMLTLMVTTLQREAARLSGGYIKAYVESELGHSVSMPPIDATQVGSARSGEVLRKSLMSPLIGVKVRIRDGTDVKEALALERSALERMVGLATDTAAREALAQAIKASPHIAGWQRAIRGTCGACLAAADGTKDGEVHFEVHPECQCVQEPVVQAKTGEYGSERYLARYKDPNDPRATTADYMKGRAQAYKLSATNVRTAKEWQGWESKTPNAFLRAGKELYDHDQEFVNNMDALLSKTGPLGANVQTYRAVGADVLQKLGPLDELPGKVFTDKGFMATTPKSRALATWGHSEIFSDVKGRTVWNMTVHKDVKAVWEEAATGEDWGIQELVLERNCRIVVEATENLGPKAGEEWVGDVWRIKVTVLPPLK